MELNALRMPEIDRPGLKADQKIRMVMEYMIALEKQMRFALTNLDEDNFSAELAGSMRETQGGLERLTEADYDQRLKKKLNAADIRNDLTADKPGMVLDAQQGTQLRVLLEEKQDRRTLLDRVYPVGAIYMSVTPIEPSAVLGGVWERLKDRFLLGAGDGHAAGETGGEAAHVLTEAEMPRHVHALPTAQGTGGEMAVQTGEAGGTQGETTLEAGGGLAHNNLPPYLTVYMWKRTE